MEIEIAFKALAFFAAFMAARSLTAYFKKSNSAAKRQHVCGAVGSYVGKTKRLNSGGSALHLGECPLLALSGHHLLRRKCPP
jgi:hypothetical protein